MAVKMRTVYEDEGGMRLDRWFTRVSRTATTRKYASRRANKRINVILFDAIRFHPESIRMSL
jgi:hypothetical protein